MGTAPGNGGGRSEQGEEARGARPRPHGAQVLDVGISRIGSSTWNSVSLDSTLRRRGAVNHLVSENTNVNKDK